MLQFKYIYTYLLFTLLYFMKLKKNKIIINEKKI